MYTLAEMETRRLEMALREEENSAAANDAAERRALSQCHFVKKCTAFTRRREERKSHIGGIKRMMVRRQMETASINRQRVLQIQSTFKS